MEYNSGSNLASDFNYEYDYPRIVLHEVFLPINWVNNKMRETLELKIQYKGRYSSYQCIISLTSTFLSVKQLCKMSNN